MLYSRVFCLGVKGLLLSYSQKHRFPQVSFFSVFFSSLYKLLLWKTVDVYAYFHPFFYKAVNDVLVELEFCGPREDGCKLSPALYCAASNTL